LQLKINDMKYQVYAFIVLCFISFRGHAERDSVLTLDTNDVFYSLEDGSSTSVDRKAWHIAFTLANRDVSILINEGNGVELFLASSNTADWPRFDTTGMSWDNLYNSPDVWEEGAFNTAATGPHPDYGWGSYNAITHAINESRFFVIKLGDGSYKKIKINTMSAAGEYSFTYSNLDGSSELTKSIDKSDYSAKNFVYFNLESGVAIDEEPLSNSWDLVFTKYVAEIQAGPSLSYYPVSGIKVNKNLKIAKREAVLASSDDTTGLNWESSITTIGYDWKSFNRTTFQYDIQDSLAFLVKNNIGEVWKLVFTGYEGSGQGKYSFEKTKISEGGQPTGLGNMEGLEVKVYPNPSKGKLHFSNEVISFQLFNMSGQLLHSSYGLQISVDVSSLEAGSYIAVYKTEESSYRSRLIIE